MTEPVIEAPKKDGEPQDQEPTGSAAKVAKLEQQLAEAKTRAEKELKDTHRKMHEATQEAARLKRELDQRQQAETWEDWETGITKEFEEDASSAVVKGFRSLAAQQQAQMATLEQKIEKMGERLHRKVLEADPEKAKAVALLSEIDSAQTPEERIELISRWEANVREQSTRAREQEDLTNTAPANTQHRVQEPTLAEKLAKDDQVADHAKRSGMSVEEIAQWSQMTNASPEVEANLLGKEVPNDG